MHKFIILFLSISLMLILLPGCTEDPNRPKDLIPEDDYIDLLIELQLIKSFSQSQLADSISVDSLTRKIFEKYEVNRERFNASHNYYQNFPDQQKVRIDSAIERLRMDEIHNSIKDRSDTVRPTSSTSDTVQPPTRPSSP